MNLDAVWVWTFSLVFARCAAMMIASPFYGRWVPVQTRVLGCAVISLALTPVIVAHAGVVPQTVSGLVFGLAFEVVAGLLIGSCVHAVLLGAQMAGAFLDMQIGLGQTQLLNPQLGSPVSLLAQFYYILGTVLLFSVDGHHVVFRALVDSYSLAPGGWTPSVHSIYAGLMTLLPTVFMLSLQIAAPVAGAAVVVDAAAGIVNKSVPTMPVYLVALPVKIAVGIVMIGVALPSFAGLVHVGVEHAYDAILITLGGG